MAGAQLTSRPITAAFNRPATKPPSLVAVASGKRSTEQVNRRAAVGLLVALPSLLGGGAAIAKSAESVKNATEERKAALRATVNEIKSTGEDKETFPESSYAVSEDKSPNVHTRQEEGMRKS